MRDTACLLGSGCARDAGKTRVVQTPVRTSDPHKWLSWFDR